ncbi:MAG: O-antigen ligase family protein [Tissierellia bacterium]|nr:O-antigen ligase family protein [Tissierellia bacterium]
MHNSIDDQTKKASIITLSIIVLSIFLNQQKPMFGYNLSFSDFAAILLILIFVFKKKLVIPNSIMLFFLLLSVITVSSAYFISPNKFNYMVNIDLIINNYLKLVSSFIYFILGYNFYKNMKMDLVYKWYSIGAVIVGLMGVLIVFFNINIINNEYLFMGSRYIGLMSDPNYFSVIQCTALVFFMRKKDLSKTFRVLCCIVIFLSIALAGSKTGMIVLICYTLIVLGETILINRTRQQLLKNLFIVLVIIILLPFLFNLFNATINAIASVYPTFDRVKILFVDFGSAISDGGSSRDRTWSVAIDIVKESPIFGVGIGSYLAVTNAVHGGGGFAHNTYLQIMAEWGMPLSSTLFIFMFYIIFKHVASNRKMRSESIIIRDIFIILLIGSLALSLNNARMFWLFLGALYKSSQYLKIGLNRYSHKETYRNLNTNNYYS